MAAGRKPGCLIPAPSQPANTLVDLGEWTSSRMTEQGLSSSLRSGTQSTAKRFVPHVHFLLMEKVYRFFLSRGARTFGLPAPLTPPDSARCGARFRRHWGTITASGTRFRYCPKSAPLPSGILPHIAAECCPTSNGISAPLRPESADYMAGCMRKRYAVRGGPVSLASSKSRQRAICVKLMRRGHHSACRDSLCSRCTSQA